MKTFLFKQKPALALLLLLWSFGTVYSQKRLADVADIDENGWISMKPNTKVAPLTFFAEYGRDLGLTGEDEMRFLKETEGIKGLKYYRFQQYYKQIPVEQSIMILHTQNGYVKNVTGKLCKTNKSKLNAKFSESDALKAALQYIGKRKYIWEFKNDTTFDHMKESIQGLSLEQPKGNEVWLTEDGEMNLAYAFDIYYVEEGYHLDGLKVFVDRRDGEIINTRPLSHNCWSHTGCTDQPRYPTVPIKTEGVQTYGPFCWNSCCWTLPWWLGGGCVGCPVNCTWFTGTLLDDCQCYNIQTLSDNYTPYYRTGQGTYWGCNYSNGLTAHWAAKETYNYFLNYQGLQGMTGGCPGFPNNIIALHLAYNYQNASAYPGLNYIEIGYGSNWTFSTLDVVGHEYTHKITDYHSNLTYQGESGALNESFSDIFGTMTELSNGLVSNPNYLIGEDLDFSNPNNSYTAIRSLAEPNLYDQPDTYLGQYWVSTNSTNDYGGVHTNSGVQNYWFYLLSEGGTGVNDLGNPYCVQAIGKEKAAKIAFQNLISLYSSANYFATRANSILIAESIFGQNSFEVAQVIAAWYAVGVGTNYSAYPF